MKVEERPVSVPDFLATVCLALGIDPLKQNQSNVGRPDPHRRQGRQADPGVVVVRWLFLAGLVAGLGCALGAVSEVRPTCPRKSAAKDVQEFVFLGGRRPVLSACTFQVDGRPFRTLAGTYPPRVRVPRPRRRRRPHQERGGTCPQRAATPAADAG